MMDIILDGVIDTLKLLPYLFVTFILLEFIEHKLSHKNKELLSKNKKYGVFLGSILGALPQCGFSSMAANLFSGRVITIGALVAVFLSTSDEMLPMMISENADIWLILKIVGFKVLVGLIIGLIVDFIFRKNENKEHIHDLCEEEHCKCEKHGIFLSSLIHTLKIGLFILIVNLTLNIIIEKFGEDSLKDVLLNKNIFKYFIASLIGLIPNCAGSVIITELYLSSMITTGTMLSGLLTGSGIGILLLFKSNKNIKENMLILSIIYFTGVIIGFFVDLVL